MPAGAGKFWQEELFMIMGQLLKPDDEANADAQAE